jgi:hypothetical protein
VAVSFIGGGNRKTLRKPPTCRKSLPWTRFKLTTLVVIGNDFSSHLLPICSFWEIVCIEIFYRTTTYKNNIKYIFLTLMKKKKKQNILVWSNVLTMSKSIVQINK